MVGLFACGTEVGVLVPGTASGVKVAVAAGREAFVGVRVGVV
jgi:hypothetical protein